MFRIGDFSKLGQVTARTLRLYDELSLLRPAQIDQFTDYRYYTIEQLPRLNRILALKDLGFSLEEIADLLNGKVKEDRLYEMLSVKQAEIEREMQENKARLARVAARLKQIEQEGDAPKYEVVLKKVEPQIVASVRGIVPRVEEMGEYRARMLKDLYGWLEENRMKPFDPEIFVYHNPEYTDTDIDMEVATAVDKAALKALAPAAPFAIRELPAAEQVASTIHKGALWEVPQAIIALFAWIGANNFTSGGVVRELHLFWREFETDDATQQNVMLEVQIPVSPLDSHVA
ncbi:MAG: MerR family transcriptional regulator [Chloroflexi bacterium]|nr:MerR family transcriptional regulator [Chloroflexota bacterium]